MSRLINTKMGMPFRIELDDGTLWPHPDAFGQAALAEAYRLLLTHPWGANVAASKVRMLRRALREAPRSDNKKDGGK